MALSSAGAASKIALMAVGATALLALSACQVGGTGAYSGGAPAPAAGSEIAQPAAAGGQAPAAGGSGGGTSRCTAADLSVEITYQSAVAPAQTASWLLTASNTSSRSCAVNGYPSFGLEDASGSLWSDSRTQYVRHPGAPMKIILKPGRTAFAGVKWAVCGSGDLVGGLVMTPPGDTEHVKVTVNTDSDSERLKLFRVCSHSVTAGSLQPATQGVVFAS
jgi:hypothetical protein